MPWYAFGSFEPEIAVDAFVHPDAIIIGDVRIGAKSSVWPRALISGEFGSVNIGARTSVQDGAVVTSTDGHPVSIGDDCVIGHLARVSGAFIDEMSLVGAAAEVEEGASIGMNAVVGAKALIPRDTVVPPRARALGRPARIDEELANVELIRVTAASYVRKVEQYLKGLRRLD